MKIANLEQCSLLSGGVALEQDGRIASGLSGDSCVHTNDVLRPQRYTSRTALLKEYLLTRNEMQDHTYYSECVSHKHEPCRTTDDALGQISDVIARTSHRASVRIQQLTTS